jgi:hypothetical protein
MIGSNAEAVVGADTPKLFVPRMFGAEVDSVLMGMSVVVNTMEEQGDHKESTLL